jgi:osmotically-inducible protein OsmY
MTMTATLTVADTLLRDAVMRQLKWAPEFDASMIGVTTQGGIVTLSGYVQTYAAKLAAERAARKVYGVEAIANELEVRLAQERIDPDLARDAVEALKARVDVPLDIDITVRDGYITLTGTVEWMFQKMAAERAVRYLRGVRGVFNQIAIKARTRPQDIEKRISEALHRHADLEARRIHVEAHEGRVILSGNVRSWREKQEAQEAAWAAPGVMSVESRINVIP